MAVTSVNLDDNLKERFDEIVNALPWADVSNKSYRSYAMNLLVKAVVFGWVGFTPDSGLLLPNGVIEPDGRFVPHEGDGQSVLLAPPTTSPASNSQYAALEAENSTLKAELAQLQAQLTKLTSLRAEADQADQLVPSTTTPSRAYSSQDIRLGELVLHQQRVITELKTLLSVSADRLSTRAVPAIPAMMTATQPESTTALPTQETSPSAPSAPSALLSGALDWQATQGTTLTTVVEEGTPHLPGSEYALIARNLLEILESGNVPNPDLLETVRASLNAAFAEPQATASSDLNAAFEAAAFIVQAFG